MSCRRPVSVSGTAEAVWNALHTPSSATKTEIKAYQAKGVVLAGALLGALRRRVMMLAAGAVGVCAGCRRRI
jgi:hypothetical protein